MLAELALRSLAAEWNANVPKKWRAKFWGLPDSAVWLGIGKDGKAYARVGKDIVRAPHGSAWRWEGFDRESTWTELERQGVLPL
ncbi:MAG: hypothetical protein ABIE42_09270, partial [Candidatus Eisenbacteria bacterium]